MIFRAVIGWIECPLFISHSYENDYIIASQTWDSPIQYIYTEKHILRFRETQTLLYYFYSAFSRNAQLNARCCSDRERMRRTTRSNLTFAQNVRTVSPRYINNINKTITFMDPTHKIIVLYLLLNTVMRLPCIVQYNRIINYIDNYILPKLI